MTHIKLVLDTCTVFIQYTNVPASVTQHPGGNEYHEACLEDVQILNISLRSISAEISSDDLALLGDPEVLEFTIMKKLDETSCH